MKLSTVLLCLAASTSCWATPITVASVSASSTCCVYNVQNLINGAGLSGGLHDNSFSHMWLASSATATVTFDLGSTFSLSDVQIWNYNSTISLNRSTQDLTVLISNDGVNYTTFNSFTLPEGTGSPISATDLNLTGAAGEFVELDLTSNYGTSLIGLSAVQFDGTAVSATPEPTSAILLCSGIGVLAWTRRRIRTA
jgi:hypothetical protein